MWDSERVVTVPGTSAKNTERNSFPLFHGADRLLKLIGALYQRPRFGDRPRDLRETDGRWGDSFSRPERSGRKGLPMVCLVRPDGPENLLTAIDKLLENAKPRGVRYAYLTREGKGSASGGPRTEFTSLTKEDVQTTRAILQEARNKLVKAPKVRDNRLNFPLFTLVGWLMDQELDENDPNPERTLLRRIQRLGLNQRFRAAVQDLEAVGPTDKFWWKGPLEILRWLTLVTFRVAVTGQVPLVSGQYRWFLLQPHLAPEMSGSFVRFAERLIREEWTKEAPEYVARLLVNAFLEDLRRAYRLRPWQVWRKRRMTYPTLLLDHITMDNGGYTLLRLINDVRNQVGLFDPLLVISASHEVPPDDGADDPDRPHYDAAGAVEGYRAWQNVLLADRRARRDNAWYLPIRIPGTSTERELRETRQKLGSFDGYAVGRRAARPMWWATRRARIGIPVLVAALIAAGLLVNDARWLSAHCGTDSPLLVKVGDECVGVSDGTYNLFQPADTTTLQVEHTIMDQNRRAADEHGADRRRPYITLVDVEALTSQTNTAAGLTAERESLEGFAVAQARQLDKSSASDPIVRILIANAGQGMREGTLVGQQLGELAASDPGLVGVIGLDISSQPTEDTIRALTSAGIPMVAATLSADNLAEVSPLYFQVAPQNSRQVAVAEAFAEHRLTADPTVSRSVRVYYSDDGADTYSVNLRQDALARFRAHGFQVGATAFTPSDSAGAVSVHQRFGDHLLPTANAAGRDTCGFTGIAFFAGRGVPDFGDFLSGAAQCGSKAVLIGDDDVTRFVADTTAREQSKALPYYYVTFAPAPTEPQGEARDFYSNLDSLFGFEKVPVTGRSLDGHAALSFDAAQVLIIATGYLRENSVGIPVTAGAVWREITAIHPTPAGQPQVNNIIDGATGVIDYGGDISLHVPKDKPVAILGVHGGEVDQTPEGFCGLEGGYRQSTWCPKG